MINNKKNIVSIVSLITIITLFSWLKINTITGTHAHYFSLLNCVAPLIGIFTGSLGMALFFAYKISLKLFAITNIKSLILALHLPTFFGSWYLMMLNPHKPFILKHRIFAALCALTCMILFCLHPVGYYAAPYSLYWFIPIIAALIPHNFFWLYALGSTFTTHAFGSVLWLYCGIVPVSSAWLALIPIVAFERLIFSFGIMACYYTITTINEYAIRPIHRKIISYNKA